MLSPEQIEQRLAGITATDIAAIIGIHPNRTEIDVWREKMGLAAPFLGNTRTKWGERLEPLVRLDYEERHNCRIEVPGTLTHPDHSWRMATPDGIAYFNVNEAERGLEIKCHGDDAMRFVPGMVYGDPGTDEVPPWELVQCAWNIEVSRLPRWDLVSFYDGIPIEYTIMRDDELNGMLVERAEKFLVDHVQSKTPPAPDGSDSYGEWLKTRWAKNSETFVDITMQPEIVLAVDALRDKKALAADLEVEIERIVQQLKVVIGENAGIVWPPERRNSKPATHRITWKRNKDGAYTDHAGTLLDVRTTAAILGSGKAHELDALERLCLKYGGAYVGNTTISGVDLLKVVQLIRSTLTDIARGANEASYQKSKPGNRPFLTPRNWKTTKEKSE